MFYVNNLLCRRAVRSRTVQAHFCANFAKRMWRPRLILDHLLILRVLLFMKKCLEYVNYEPPKTGTYKRIPAAYMYAFAQRIIYNFRSCFWERLSKFWCKLFEKLRFAENNTEQHKNSRKSICILRELGSVHFSFPIITML